MKPSTLLFLGASLLTSGVLAVTYESKLIIKGVEHPATLTPGVLPQRKSLPDLHANVTNSKRSGPISVTNNWAGAIQEAPTSGVFRTIHAEWQVPGVYAPPGVTLGSSAYWLYEWVGISSDCGTILQAGTAQVKSTSENWNFVWFEWFPNANMVTNLPVAYRDYVTVTITASSTTSGTVVIENETQGATFSINLSNMSPDLCLDNAEWVVENPVADSMPWGTFENVYFDSCKATTNTGAVQGITGTTAIHGASRDGRMVLSEYVDNTDMYVKP